MMELSFGIVFGLLAMFSYGLSNAIVKVPAKNVGSVKTIFFRTLITVPLLSVIFLLFLPMSTLSMQYVLLTILISFIGYLPLAAFFKALSIGKVGVVTPIANSSVVFTVLLSVLFFAEELSFVQYSSIGLIVLGIVFISIDFGDLKKSNLFDASSGIHYALVATILWGVVFFLLKIPVTVLGPILTTLILESMCLVLSASHLRIAKMSFSIPNWYNLKYIFFMAVTGMFGTLFFNFGISVAEVSIVAALTFANPLVSTVYARAVYKEKLCVMQYAAIGLILLGVVLISYF